MNEHFNLHNPPVRVFLSGNSIKKSLFQARAQNQRMLYLVFGVALVYGLALTIYSQVEAVQMSLRLAFVMMSVLSAGALVLLQVVAPDHPRMVDAMVPLSHVLFLCYTVQAGVIMQPTACAISYHIPFLILSFCFMVTPLELALYQCAGALIYCGCSLTFKPLSIAYMDVINATLMAAVSIVLGVSMLRMRTHELEIIKAREATQMKLNASNQKYQIQSEYLNHLLDSITCGVVQYEGDPYRPSMIYANVAAAHIQGYDAADEFIAAMGDCYTAYIDPRDQEHMAKIITRVSNNDASEEFSHRIIKKDGSSGWVQGKLRMHTTQQGKRVVQGTYFDATARRELDARHEEQLNYLDALCRTLPFALAIYGLNPSYELLYANDERYRILGMEKSHPSDWSLNNYKTMVDPDDAPQMDRAVSIASRQNIRMPFECHLLRPDGTKRNVRGCVERAENVDGTPVVRMAYIDITTEEN